MNRLLALLTLASWGAMASVGAAGAVPVAAGLDRPAMTGVVLAQLGNGGPIGGGPNGGLNGTGSRVGSGTFRGAAPAGTSAFATGNGSIDSGLPGGSRGPLPSGSNARPNGAKPAPMRANGVRKVQ